MCVNAVFMMGFCTLFVVGCLLVDGSLCDYLAWAGGYACGWLGHRRGARV